MHIQFLRRVFQRTAVAQKRGNRHKRRIVGILAMKHLIHVLIQLFTSVIIAQQRPFRQQLIGTQRAGRRRQSGSRLQGKQGFTQHVRSAGDTGTHRTQIHRFVIFESGHNRRAGHFGSGGATLTDKRQQKTAVCANNHMFSAQIAHRLTRNERSRSGTRFRCAANRETIEIPTPTKHIHQRGDAIIRKRSHQAFESEPFDG